MVLRDASRIKRGQFDNVFIPIGERVLCAVERAFEKSVVPKPWWTAIAND